MKVGKSDEDRFKDLAEKELHCNEDFQRMKDLFDIKMCSELGSRFDTDYFDIYVKLICDGKHITSRHSFARLNISVFDIFGIHMKNQFNEMFHELKQDNDIKKVLDNIALKEKLELIIPDKAPEAKRKTKI